METGILKVYSVMELGWKAGLSTLSSIFLGKRIEKSGPGKIFGNGILEV